MIYDENITHCSGYLCPLADECLRFKLLEMWTHIYPKPNTTFMSSKYNNMRMKCSQFLPINKLNGVE